MNRYPTKLHIVAFDVPYPADYGGVIDIFYKIKALYSLGIHITLHMFQYGRERADDALGEYCQTLHYYKRSVYKNPFLGNKPYIVNSRNSELLLENLLKDNAPILFEGLHSTFFLGHKALSTRFKIVRTHNIEHHYYKQLENSELRYFKKYFFRIEAEKLKKYEGILKHANLIAAISPNDATYLEKKYKNVIYVPAFHGTDKMAYPGARGEFVLYHGNLSVPENYVAAIQLVNEVFSKLDKPCIIAGNNPPPELEKLCEQYHHIQLQSHVTTLQINKLIEKAHINVLYTNQNTGIKLKLLNALFAGKFAIVNNLMVAGSGLEKVCVVANDFDGIIANIDAYFTRSYTQENFAKRKEYLVENFGNKRSAEILKNHIFGE